MLYSPSPLHLSALPTPQHPHRGLLRTHTHTHTLPHAHKPIYTHSHTHVRSPSCTEAGRIWTLLYKHTLLFPSHSLCLSLTHLPLLPSLLLSLPPFLLSSLPSLPPSYCLA